jgi:competence protein ComEC
VILFFVALAWLAGSAGAALGFASLWPAAMLGGAGVCCGLVLAGRRGEGLLVGIALLAVLLGVTRYEDARPPARPGGVALLNDAGEVQVHGVIVSEPEETQSSQRFTVAVDSYAAEDGSQSETSGRVQVTARLFPRYQYGDEVMLTGMLETAPVFESFDYRDYLARRGVTSVSVYPQIEVVSSGGGSAFQRALVDVRRPLGEALERSLAEPESALARGILLGQRAAIPPDLTDDLNRAGISHLIAISGYNVMLVAGFVTASLAWAIGRKQATLAAMVLVLAYSLFVGASPSVLRAAVMAQVMLGATLAGRPGSALGGVMLAGALLVAWRPLIIDDVSFQLSFAATLGIVLLAERLRERLQPRLGLLPDGAAAFVAEQLAVTSAASIAVLPIIAASFGRLSLVSLPANLLAAPSFALALGAAGLTAVAGVIDAGAGRLVGDVAYLPLAYLVWLGRTASSLPYASLSLGGFGLIKAVAAYLAIGAGAYLLLRNRPELLEPSQPLRLRPALAFTLVLLIASGVVWSGALASHKQGLRVVVLDVGQGDSILIETPAGHHILVDGGPSGAVLMQALGHELGASERRIDLMVLTHGQDDHVTGLVDVLQRFDVRQVLAGPLPGETAAYRAWRDEVEARGVPMHQAVAGEWLDLGEGARIEVLGPPEQAIHGTEDDLNNNCVVLRLVYGDTSFLLTGDLAGAGEAALLNSNADLDATVLKVGHHGSEGSSSRAFLDTVDPGLAVISVGADNPYGHPSPALRLRLAGTPYLRTDQNGDVSIESDGRALRVDFDRGDYSMVTAGIAK